MNWLGPKAGMPTMAEYERRDDPAASYAYDLASKPAQISDGVSGAINWTYDTANRVTAEPTPAGTVGYTYNAASQRLTMTTAKRSPVSKFRNRHFINRWLAPDGSLWASEQILRPPFPDDAGFDGELRISIVAGTTRALPLAREEAEAWVAAVLGDEDEDVRR
jgi:YD repeat-containing protein